MNINKSKSFVSFSGALSMGIALGILYWFLDSAIDVYIFGNDSYWDTILSPGAEQLWMRSIIIGLIICLSIMAQFYNIRRKSIEEALLKSKAKYRGIIAAVPDGIIIHDGEFIIEANQEIAEMLGYEPNELVKKPFLEILDKKSQEQTKINLKEIKEIPYQATALRKDGSPVAVEINTRIADYENQTIWIATISAVTEKPVRTVYTRENSNHYRQLLQNCNDPLFVYGLTNENSPDLFIEVSEMACTKFGYSVDEFQKLSIMEIIVPEERDNILPVFQTLIDFKHSIFETEILTKDKERVPIEISSHLFDLDNRPMIISTLREITERKKANRLLHESEKQFRRLFAHAPVAYLSLDPDGNIIEVNKKWCDLFGYSKEEALDNWFGDFLSRSSLDRFRASFADLNESKGQMEINLEITNKDKTVSNILLIANAIQSSFGDIQSVQSVLLDNSRQKDSIDEKRRQKQWLEQIIDSTSDIIFSFKPDGTIINVNPSFEKVMGNPAEPFIDNKFDTIIHPDDLDFAHQAFDKCIEGEKIPVIEIRLRTRSNEYILTELTLTSFEDDGKVAGINCIARNLAGLWQTGKSDDDIVEGYRKQVETLPEYSVIIDKNLKIVYTNKIHRELSEKLGLKEDIIGQNVIKSYPFESEESYAVYSEVFDKAISKAREISCSTENGQFVFEIRIIPVYTGDEVSHAILIIKDISRYRQTETAFRKNEAELSLIFDNASTILALVDSERKIRKINNSGLRFAGRSKEEMLGKQGGEALGCLNHLDDPKGCGYGPNCVKCPVRNTVLETFETGVNRHHIPARLPFEIDGERKELDFLVSTTMLDSADEKLILVTIEDITDRKMTEEKLQLLSSAVEQSNEGIAVVDLDGNIQYINRTFANMHGYDPEELAGKPLTIFHTPEQMPAVDEANRQIKESGRFTGEIWHVHRNGTVFPTMINNSLIKDDEGNPIAIIGTFRDITEQKKAEKALKESEEKYRSLITNIPNVVWTSDENGHTSFISPNVLDIYGYSPEEICENRERLWFGRIHPDDIDRVKADYEKLLTDDQTFDTEYRIQRKDGQWIWLHDRAIKTYGKDGKVQVDGFFTDVTGRKQTEEALQNLSSRNKAILKAVPDIIMEVDADKVYTWSNKAGYEFFGDDVIGKEASYYFEGEQDTYEKIQPLFGGDDNVIYVESWQRRKDGEKRLLAWWCRVIKDDDGNVTGALSTARDITEQRRAQYIADSQRDLALELSRTNSFEDTLKLCLEAAIKLSETDSGGIYLADEATGAFDLVHHQGLSEDFLKASSHYEADAEHIEMVKRGQPIYIVHNEIDLDLTEASLSEGLRCLAIIPIRHNDQIIGCLNVASRKYNEISLEARQVIEIIAVQIGEAIAGARAKEALRESEERFRNIVELSIDGIILFDNECRIVEWNRGMENITGLKKEDVLGKYIYDVQFQLVPEERKNDRHYQMMKSSTLSTARDDQSPYLNEFMETEIVRSDGTCRVVEILAFPIKTENGSMTCAINRDITDKRLLEEELNKAGRLESIGILAGGIAHDFNNILTAILGNISLAKMYAVPESEIDARLIEAEKASERAQDLTRQLLTFSKGGAPVKKTISIRNVIKESAGFALHGSNVKAEYDIPDDLPPVNADTGQISQVINNLIMMAVPLIFRLKMWI